jgi:hypothetical protein
MADVRRAVTISFDCNAIMKEIKAKQGGLQR